MVCHQTSYPRALLSDVCRIPLTLITFGAFIVIIQVDKSKTRQREAREVEEASRPTIAGHLPKPNGSLFPSRPPTFGQVNGAHAPTV